MTGHDPVRVAAGYKATLARSDVSEEAKAHARAELKKMGVEVDSADSGSSEPTKTHAEEVHDHRVIGGLKAATHNPNVSEEAKDKAREKLEAMGETAE